VPASLIAGVVYLVDGNKPASLTTPELMFLIVIVYEVLDRRFKMLAGSFTFIQPESGPER
jgi:hypothetical protein